MLSLLLCCWSYWIVIGRRRRRGTPQGSGFWIQSPVPAAQREEDSGYVWNAVAGRSTRCAVHASS